MRTVWWWSVLAAAVTLALGAGVIVLVERQWDEQQRKVVQELAATAGLTLQRQLNQALAAPEALAALLRQNKRIENFQGLAADLVERTASLRALFLAPDGQITQAYPSEPSSWPALELTPPEEATLRLLTLQEGTVLGLLPVFLPDDLGQERFWGLIGVELAPEAAVRASGLARLQEQGYRIRLLQPSGRPLWQSDAGPLPRPVTFELPLTEATWQLQLAPRAGWPRSPSLGAEVALVAVLGALMGALTFSLLRQPFLLRRQVAARTQELHEANRRLREQMARLRETEVALRRSEARFRDLFEKAGDAIYILDAQGALVTLNRQAERLLELPREAARGRRVELFVLLQQRRRARRAFLRVLRGRTETLVLDIASARGRKRTVELSARPLQRPDGRREVQIIARDVTERVALERLRSEFVSTVSHELRTPLTSIKGFADLLQAGQAGPLNPTQQEFLDIITQNTDRLTHLINDLLVIERLESGRVPLQFERLPLASVLAEVARAFQVIAADKGLTFTFQAPEELWVRGDPRRLVQAFSNLVSNAVKYTERGQVWLKAWAEAERAVVEVGDTGIGIAPEDQAHLFERFFRASHEVVRRAGGTGLGLAIAKTTVERHGGQILVCSELGRGTRFRVALPLVPEETR